MPARLTLISGIAEPSTIDLAPDQPVRIGRNRRNAMALRDEHASREHAEVYFRDNAWWIEEIDSPRNGTRIDGQVLQQKTQLRDGAEIRIGATRLRFTASELTGATVELLRTPLPADDLNALFAFVAASLELHEPEPIIDKALAQVLRQTGAAVAGFLSLDAEDPLPRVVRPTLKAVDIQLSRQLTLRVQKEGRTVWLAQHGQADDASDSLLPFSDALCLPLRAGGTPLGALHVYRAGSPFADRDRRFCEVLAALLASSLHYLRARRSLEAENSRLRSHAADDQRLVGESAIMQDLRQRIARLAPLSKTVMIRGESGAGKELVAIALHRQSPRREGPLVAVNCAAIAAGLQDAELFGHEKGAFTGALEARPGLFRQADQGTLFFDEIGELSLDCQAKLLRVMENKSFRPVGATAEANSDVRIVAATNRDLEKETAAGRFRQDLAFRLLGVQLVVPPLRDHLEDIPALAQHFLEQFALEHHRALRITDAALLRLQGYSWPGNVRQLRSVLEIPVIWTDKRVLDADDFPLPEAGLTDAQPVLNLEELEKKAIQEALRRTNGNVTQAAGLLGVGRDTLASKVKRYHIDRHQPGQ